jgi:hypothetical protein
MLEQAKRKNQQFVWDTIGSVTELGRVRMQAMQAFLVPCALAIVCLAWCPWPAWPSGGFTGSVALSCAVSGGPMGAADAPTCSVTAPPATTGSAPVTATLTVSTTAASAAAYSRPVARAQHLPPGVTAGGSVVAVASLLWFGFPLRRRRTVTQFGLLLIATLIGTAMGCGGGAAAPSATPANPGTTPGAYTVTVTGSSGAITATTAVTVTLN